MRRATIPLALLTLVLVSCGVTGRTATELKETPFGRMPPPRGTGLVSEWYVATDWTPEGPVCAHLVREFATNDPVAFTGAFAALADRAGGQLDRSALTINGASDGGFRDSASATVAGTSVSLEILDLDSEVGLRRVASIDRSVWRYVADLYVWDREVGRGGKCGQNP